MLVINAKRDGVATQVPSTQVGVAPEQATASAAAPQTQVPAVLQVSEELVKQSPVHLTGPEELLLHETLRPKAETNKIILNMIFLLLTYYILVFFPSATKMKK